MLPSLRPDMQLCRLPKLEVRHTLKWRGSVKGDVGPLIGHSKFDKKDVLDPKHPALRDMGARTPRSPYYHDPGGAFSARIFPNGILTKSDNLFDEESYHEMMNEERHSRPEPHGRRQDRKVTKMGWVNIVGIQSTHKSAVIRTRLHSKMKTATALIINRGAVAEPISGSQDPASTSVTKDTKRSQKMLQSSELKPELRWDHDDASPEKWIVANWTYVFFLKMPVLRMPYNELIYLVRRALEQLKREALKLQATYDHLKRTTSKSPVISSTNSFSHHSTTSKHGKTSPVGQPGPSKAPKYIKTQAHKPKYPSMVMHETASKKIMPGVEDETQDEQLHQDFMEEMQKLRDALPLSNQSPSSQDKTVSGPLNHLSLGPTPPLQPGHTPVRRTRTPRSNPPDTGGISTEHSAVVALSGVVDAAIRSVPRSARRVSTKGAHGLSPQETPANQTPGSHSRHKPRSRSEQSHQTLSNTSARLFRERPLVMPSKSTGHASGSKVDPGRHDGDEKE